MTIDPIVLTELSVNSPIYPGVLNGNFDALKDGIDERYTAVTTDIESLETTAGGALPKTGGTMTGNITISKAADGGWYGLIVNDANDTSKYSSFVQAKDTANNVYFARLVNTAFGATALVDVVINSAGYRIISLSNTDEVQAPTPASSDNSTKVATTAFVRSLIGNNMAIVASSGLTSNAAKGYVKLQGIGGEKLAIAWGYTTGSGEKVTISFGVTFANTNYGMVVSSVDQSEPGADGYGHVYSKSTTGCKVVVENGKASWVCIGRYA